MVACPWEIGADVIAHERSTKRHLLCVSGIYPPQQGTRVQFVVCLALVVGVDYDGTRD